MICKKTYGMTTHNVDILPMPISRLMNSDVIDAEKLPRNQKGNLGK